MLQREARPTIALLRNKMIPPRHSITTNNNYNYNNKKARDPRAHTPEKKTVTAHGVDASKSNST